MGALRLIGIPFRRLLHDGDLANAMMDGSWSAFKEHAFGAVVLAAILGVILFLSFMAAMVISSFMVMPFKAIKKWQRKRILKDEQGQNRFMRFILIILIITLVVIADAIWSNVTAFSLYEVGDKLLALIDIADRQIVTVNNAVAEAQRFMSGFTGMLTKAATGNTDLRPILSTVDAFLNESKSFIWYINAQPSVIASIFARANDGINSGIKGLHATVENSSKLHELSSEIGSLNGVLSDLQGLGTNSSGLMSIGKLFPSLALIRNPVIKHNDSVKLVELIRFMSVFAMILLITGCMAAGMQFLRSKKFRLVSLCVLGLLITLNGLQLLAIIHLLLGTLLGGVCDGIYGYGGQNPIVLAKEGNFQVTAPNLYQLSLNCALGSDMSGALMKTYSSSDKLVSFGDFITLDGPHKELSINTGSMTLTIPVVNGKGDLKKAVDHSIEKLMVSAGPEILATAQATSQQVGKAASEFKNFEFETINESLGDLLSMLNTFDVNQAPSGIQKELLKSKLDMITKMESLRDLLKRLKDQSSNIEDAVSNLYNFLNVANTSPSTYIAQVQQELRNNINPFVANTLQPVFECKQVGGAFVTTVDSFCGAGSALQSLFISLIWLVSLTIGMITVFFVCRKFIPGRDENDNDEQTINYPQNN